MKSLKRAIQILLCLLLCVCNMTAVLAEDPDGETPDGAPVEVEGVANEESVSIEVDAASEDASIDGLKPLYVTKIKPFTATGTYIRMRKRQNDESDIVCAIAAGKQITVYRIDPMYVLAEYEGNVGYVKRTWVNEEMTVLDPVNTPPYGVCPMQYVATAAVEAKVHMLPSLGSDTFPIVVGAGSKISIIEFRNGFAKVLYWRNYGYIDARLLTDLVVVSQTNQPLSEDTPIAAFCSFFAYNNGAEGNDGRCKNIVRSCELMTRVLQPGETLDFNAQIGPYRRTNGYFPAPVLIDGGSQLGYGGGTCQSSSTLYNTVRQLPGVTILKRRPHGPGCAKYLPMHQDAAVGNKELNFIFRNDYTYPIRVLAESKGEGTICIQIFRGE